MWTTHDNVYFIALNTLSWVFCTFAFCHTMLTDTLPFAIRTSLARTQVNVCQNRIHVCICRMENRAEKRRKEESDDDDSVLKLKGCSVLYTLPHIIKDSIKQCSPERNVKSRQVKTLLNRTEQRTQKRKKKYSPRSTIKQFEQRMGKKELRRHSWRPLV